MEKFQKLLGWIKKNERHISTVVFIFGFVSDLFTYILIPVSIIQVVFLVYLGLTALCAIVSHFLYTHGYDFRGGFWKVPSVFLPLAIQFLLGNLLSGFLIFYTKSSVFTVSWPFLVFIALIFLGNEVFRDYRSHLAFQSVLFFFALYAYVIFGFPLVVHTLGPVIFLESGVIALGVFIVFLILLGLVGWERFKKSLLITIGGVLGVLIVVNVSYFAELIPPIPLTLTEAGAYQSITREGTTYVLQGEQKQPWWNVTPQIVHLTPGAPLYVYSSVFAPIAFSSTEVHDWERYNESTHKWEDLAQIAFSINGGRQGGFRGYSTLSDLTPGTYRVSIETLSGQVIGRIRFNLVYTDTTPVLHTETRN